MRLRLLCSSPHSATATWRATTAGRARTAAHTEEARPLFLCKVRTQTLYWPSFFCTGAYLLWLGLIRCNGLRQTLTLYMVFEPANQLNRKI